MSCYVAGTGTGQGGRNQRTVIASGRAGSGAAVSCDDECGNSATSNMTSADRGFKSSGI